MRELPTVKRLGDRLLDCGLITHQQLELALREQKRTGDLIGVTLQELGFVKEQDIAAFLAQDAQTEVIDILEAEIDPNLSSLIPYDLAKQFIIIPFRQDGDTLSLAMSDPFNVIAIDTVEQLTHLKIRVLTAAAPQILERLVSLYEEGNLLDQTINELMRIDGEGGDTDDTAPMIRFVDEILFQAVKMEASDIHFEPDERVLRIRIRVDGILQPYLLVPKDLQDSISARLKVLGNLDVAECRLPQDGRASLTKGHREINLRISTMPTCYGESVVLRILDGSSAVPLLSALGMESKEESLILNSVAKPHGIILVTGPTGSGKTTTLYTTLNAVNAAERSILTLEDPIEYRLGGVRQTQINEKIGLTFAGGLRNLLRQDPDVILVGETRDRETAQLMVRAALTGHLVLSSLHTNDSISAIPRLIDLEVEPFLLPATLQLVIAQRLVRRLCSHCREEISEARSLLEELPVPLDKEESFRLWRSGQCSVCNDSGYRGRIGIYELLNIDDDYHSILPTGDVEKIRSLALEKGLIPLLRNGVKKATEGITTLEEVFRVSQ